MKTLLKKTLAVVMVASLSASIAHAQSRLPNRVVGNTGPQRGGNPMPDLVVHEFVKTGAVSKQGMKYAIPFRLKVRNVGNADTGSKFVSTIRVGNQSEFKWNSWSQPLQPGGTRTFQGVIKVPVSQYIGGGRTITLIAKADTEISGGDTSKSDWVSESNEFNNQKWLKVKTPGQLDMTSVPKPPTSNPGNLQRRPTTTTLPQTRPATRPHARPSGRRAFGRR